MRPSDIPNLITGLRLLAVIPVVYLLFQREFELALLVFAFAGISDGVDGFLARYYGWQSRVGGILDPLADKVLLVASFLVLGALGLIPAWLVAVAIGRDLLIVGGAVYYNYLVEPLEAEPSPVSKLNTLLQILLVVMTIADAGPLPMPQLLLKGLIWACLATAVFSGVQYVWVWTRKARSRGWGQD